MDVRRGFIALLLLVAATTLTHAISSNGQFSHGDRLPGWAVAVSIVVTLGALGAVLWWLARNVGWSGPPIQRGSAAVYVVLIVIAAVSHGLAIGAEILLNAQGLWLVLPIATIGYGLFIVWFQKRYGSPRTVAGEP